MKNSIVSVPVRRIPGRGRESELDLVAVEEPLQIRVNGRDVAITMRTPGHDRELAAGFLFSEGILRNAGEIASITPDGKGGVDLVLASAVELELGPRDFYLTSSCGVCGKASIEALRQAGAASVGGSAARVTEKVLFALPEQLRQAQSVFEHTGGLHAAGLFTANGNLIALREDVGRHNAVDKILGAAVLENQLPLNNHVLMLSGRISFELVQKAVMAGIAMIAAVGAPSSLAVETALRFGVTLVGFLREGRGNVYSRAERVSRVID